MFFLQNFVDLLKQVPGTNIKSPANTIAHIFRHDQKENFISDWLAFLLNPEYTGSTEPLSALLRLTSEASSVDLSDVFIIRESVFEDKRRIDFLIETNSHIIGIENKIWSDLQDKQLSDYQKQLTEKANIEKKELLLILLYPQRNTFCHNLKKEERGEFRLATYEDLVSEFKQIRFNIFENLRAVVLMEDFIAHMEEYIMHKTDIGDSWEMWNFEANHQSELLELKKAQKKSKEQFGKYLAERMNDVVSCRVDCDEWKTYIGSTYFQLYKASWEKAHVHFELLKSNEYAPTEITVALHTHELGNTGKTTELYDLGGKIGKKIFPISYETETAFHTSMDTVFEALKALVRDYTDIIDKEIYKAAANQK